MAQYLRPDYTGLSEIPWTVNKGTKGLHFISFHFISSLHFLLQIDISGVTVPETLNDEYFRRSKAKKVRHGEGEIFEQKKTAYVVSEQRKKDQVPFLLSLFNFLSQSCHHASCYSKLGHIEAVLSQEFDDE